MGHKLTSRTHRQVKTGRRAQEFRDEMAEAKSWEGCVLGFACFGKISASATSKT